MKLIESKLFTIPLAFILGGVTTFFVSDYIKLKKNQNIAEVVKEEKTSSSSLKDNSILNTKQNNSDTFAQMDKIHDQMRKRMDKAFGGSIFGNNFFGGSGLGGGLLGNSLFDHSFNSLSDDGIKIEEIEDENYKYIEVLADGIDKNSLNIDISNGMISISGEIRKSSDDQGANSRSMSSYISSFSRSFNIPEGVSEENVKIDMEDKKVVIKFPMKRI